MRPQNLYSFTPTTITNMNTWALYNKVAKLIPFNLNGHNGEVSVYYGKNDDPVKAGFDILSGLNFDINLCRGFPVMYAKIENYEGSGYRMFCGWIQIVTNEFFKSYDEENTKGKKFVSVDVAPSMRDSDIPFASFGHLPQFFDAPCHNLGGHAKLRWVADTFLATVPLRSSKEEISWLLGFRWGYIEHDKPQQRPTVLLPLEVTEEDVWNSHLPFLKKEFKTWKFRRAQQSRQVH